MLRQTDSHPTPDQFAQLTQLIHQVGPARLQTIKDVLRLPQTPLRLLSAREAIRLIAVLGCLARQQPPQLSARAGGPAALAVSPRQQARLVELANLSPEAFRHAKAVLELEDVLIFRLTWGQADSLISLTETLKNQRLGGQHHE